MMRQTVFSSGEGEVRTWRRITPVAFRWPMKAKVEHGAKLIHVDPRFTRTSAMSDIYAPVRSGSDIAFLGALVVLTESPQHLRRTFDEEARLALINLNAG